MASQYSWSDWLDFSQDGISGAPEKPGVFMMHAAMKVLFINNSTNLKKSLQDSLSVPCISEAKRFRFMISDDHEKIKKELIEDYKNRHDGKMPSCMTS
jgi:hypothetical protein